MAETTEALIEFELRSRRLIELLQRISASPIATTQHNTFFASEPKDKVTSMVADEILPFRRAWYAIYMKLPSIAKTMNDPAWTGKLRGAIYSISSLLGFDGCQNLTAEWLIEHVRLQPDWLETVSRQLPKLEDAIGEMRAIESIGGRVAKKKGKTTGQRLKGKPYTAKMKEAIDMLARCHGDKTEASRRLNISRAAFQERIDGAKLRGDLSTSKSVRAVSLPRDRRGGISI